jgi:SAM-dependent methyltransferase
LTLAEVRDENPTRVVRGTLACTGCGQKCPVEGGVPRLVEAPADVTEIGRSFDFQWVSRRQGRFEGTDRCYGFTHEAYAGWFAERLEALRPLSPGERILDAGCGSGEKTAVLAQKYPAQSVVGMDLALGALEGAAAQFSDLGNLDFVQGNVLAPPLKPGTFPWGISIGVLHHTPDTRRAFAEFRKLLAPDAAVLIWIYPPYREASEWHLPYLARDVLLLGQGPRIPRSVLWPLSYLIVIGFLPLSIVGWWIHGKRLSRDLPFFDFDRMSLKQRFEALVFHMFDTLHPRYQFRHSRAEVEQWFREEGLEPAFYSHGYFSARGQPRPVPGAGV